MLKALVVGGFAAKTRGAWARALREQCGIEVVYHYGADNEFKGIPDELPKGVDLVLVVIGTCSHRASDKGKSLAWRGGARFEPVSKDTSRAVEWLKGKGYRAGQPVPEREPIVPLPKVEQTPEPVVEQAPEPVVEQAPEPAVEWLDVAQVRELVPLKPTTFYDLVKDVVKRPVRYERRTVWRSVGNRNYSVSQRVMVWTMDEIATIESEARKRGMLDPPKSVAPAPEPLYKLAASEQHSEPVVFPTTFTKATPVVPAAPKPAVLGELRDYHAEVVAIMEAYAYKQTRDLQAQLAEVTAERDGLREQLAKIKSALGLG